MNVKMYVVQQKLHDQSKKFMALSTTFMYFGHAIKILATHNEHMHLLSSLFRFRVLAGMTNGMAPIMFIISTLTSKDAEFEQKGINSAKAIFSTRFSHNAGPHSEAFPRRLLSCNCKLRHFLHFFLKGAYLISNEEATEQGSALKWEQPN